MEYSNELEPMNGRHDWPEAVRQNPEQGIADLPAEAEDAVARALAEETEQWLATVVGVGDVDS